MEPKVDTLEFMRIQERFHNAIDDSMRKICQEIISSLMKTVSTQRMEKQEIVVCSYCWHRGEPKDNFCGYCGHKLGDEQHK